MNKLFFAILVLAWGWVCNPAPGHAADSPVIVDGVVYTWVPSELGYLVTGWDEETPIQSLHIFGEVNGLDVFGIAENAFNYHEYVDEIDDDSPFTIECLEIDEGITSIGSNAFIDCEKLRWLRTPSTLVDIGASAFQGCAALETLVLNEGLMTIKEEAFASCNSLTSVVIPSTVRDIQSLAFMDCTGVTDVYFLMEEDGLEDFAWWDGTTQQGGGEEFNTNQNTVIHVPNGLYDDYVDSGKFSAWLPLREDDGTYPLWWIVNFGVVGRPYTVSDDLTAVYVDKTGDLYAKDDNHWLTPDCIMPGEVDYMSHWTPLMAHLNNIYDQSNWVILRDTQLPQGCYMITGRTITGILLDKRNPMMEVTSTPTKGQDSEYTPNVYIAISLMGRTQVSEANGKTFAFIRPKPQEFAQFEWTIYGGNNSFYIHHPDAANNRAELKGGFVAKFDLYEDDSFDPDEDLLLNACYPMTVITRQKLIADSREPAAKPFTPYTQGGVTPWYDVYALQLPVDSPVITGVKAPAVSCATHNAYYDLNGHYLGMTRPSTPGIYIHNGKLLAIDMSP